MLGLIVGFTDLKSLFQLNQCFHSFHYLIATEVWKEGRRCRLERDRTELDILLLWVSSVEKRGQ